MDPQPDPLEPKMILQRQEVTKLSSRADIVDAARRQPGVAPVETNYRPFASDDFVLRDEFSKLPMRSTIRSHGLRHQAKVGISPKLRLLAAPKLMASRAAERGVLPVSMALRPIRVA